MKQLLFSVKKEDLLIQNFCSGGPGGQHQNKTASGARVIHKESGAVGESREERCQQRNIKTAFKRMTETFEFKSWINHKIFELDNSVDIANINDEKIKKWKKQDGVFREEDCLIEVKTSTGWTPAHNNLVIEA